MFSRSHGNNFFLQNGKEVRKLKESCLHRGTFPYLCVILRFGNIFGLTPLGGPPSGERTCAMTSPPTYTHTQLLESKTKVSILAFRGTSICFNFTMAVESLVSLCVDYLVFWWDKAPPIKPNSKHPKLIITIRERNHHMLFSFLYLVGGAIGKP